jgi:hypothetical protein
MLHRAAAIASVASAILLVIATSRHNPYEYYTALRVIVCVTTAFNAWLCWKAGSVVWCSLFAVVSILFNPVAPIFLRRADWFPIDLIVAGTLVLWTLARSKKILEVVI